MKLNLLLLAVLAVVLLPRTTAQIGNFSVNRILGGRKTTVDNFPYMVRLYQNGKFTCGGALISATHILTAGHCVAGTRAAQLIVVGGSSALSVPGVRRKVARIIPHPKYNTRSQNRDVAVLKLARPLQGNNIQSAGLCNTAVTRGKRVRVSGWGRMGENGKISNSLRTVTLPIVARARCQSRYRGLERITNAMFCAAGNNRDSCSGDSGGPVMINGRICGVVSWGYGCGRSRFPGVYTNVQAVKGFIQRAMKI